MRSRVEGAAKAGGRERERERKREKESTMCERAVRGEVTSGEGAKERSQKSSARVQSERRDDSRVRLGEVELTCSCCIDGTCFGWN